MSIMFNFGACPAFSNLYYKISYARNMSVSINILMGSTNIGFVLYAYIINMYYITLLLAKGKRTIKYI